MISNFVQILYYSAKSRIPTILRPYNNNHWGASRLVNFVWLFNGFDLQKKFRIQIYPFDVKENEIPNEWFELIEEDDDNVVPFVGSPVVDIETTTTIQSTYIDFSTIAPMNLEDGSYLWRIRTQGTVSTSWSDWNTSGRVNLDQVAPIIRNACAESPSSYDINNNPSLASYISDMSMPFIYTNRTSLITDRHIDRNGNSGLYIYYDYRDNSITLRAQKGGSATNPRFYGLLSFHGTENELSPDYNIQSAIKAAYLYRINKDFVDGPFEQIRYDEHESGKLIGDSLSKLVYTRDSGSTTNDFIPKGFPKFWEGNGVYGGTSFHEQHPAGIDRSFSFFSTFPLSTRVITRKVTFPVAGPTGSNLTQTFTNVIEMLYPAPYNDLFILFDLAMDNILAYGQYKSADLHRLNTDITGSFNFILKRGLDVRSWKNSLEIKPNPASNLLYQFWTTIPNIEGSVKDNPNQRGQFAGFSTQQILTDNIRSNYFFFNLTANDDYDNALKIYVRPKALSYVESGAVEKIDSNAPDQIPFIEFNFSPESDCTFSGITPGGDEINIGEVLIGKAKISPKGLSYSGRNPTDKKILVNPKNPPVPFVNDDDLIGGSTIWTTVKKWGCENDVLTFNGNEINYNASFRLKIPLFRYIPYHYPGAINYLEAPTNEQPPIPNIHDADPNKDINDVIGWDTITIETKENSSEPIEALPDSSLIYPGDYIQFMGTAKPMGQINPFLYNFEKWGEDGVPRGTILRVRDYKAFQPYILKPEEYYFFGQAMFDDGWFYDGTHFNDIDRGFYPVGNITRNITSTTSDLYIINFANYLFRRSLDVANKSIFDDANEFTDDIYAIDGQSGGDSNTTLLEQTLLNLATSSLTNGKTWIYSLSTGVSASDFKEALIRGDETSVQSHFGISGEFDSTWLEDTSNPYGGEYIDLRNSDVDTDTQIKRIITISGANFHYATLSPLDRFDIPVVPAANKALRITGDTLSMGNIFGYIIPSPNNKIRLFFDADESDAGIKNVKTFQVSLDDSDSNLVDCSQFIGPKDIIDNDTKIKILSQKINNKQFDFMVPSTVTNALTSIGTSRSPISLYEYYFNNILTLWESSETSTKNCIDMTTGSPVIEEIEYTSDEPGYFHEISVTGTGLKLIFVQIRDRSNNISGLYSIPVFIPAGATIEPFTPIKSSTISVDDGQVIREIASTTVGPNTYEFVKHLLPNDIDKSRSIIIKKLIIEDIDNPGDFKPVDNVNELIAGFSDNYGLSFNIFSPLSSINTWRFTRPISIRSKSYTQSQRFNEPMWFFDPNHVRHYSSDTDADFVYYNSNNKIQANNSLTAVTLLGFQLKTGSINDINPMAQRLLQFKEEFIGKTLRLGNLADQDFTILHIFNGTISPITKTTGNSTRTIDGDSISKVWVVIEDPDSIAAIVASRKFQYITKTNDPKFNEAKKYTYKNDSSGFGGASFTLDFGYEKIESNIDSDVNEIINTALKMDGNITTGNSTEIINIPGETDPSAFNEGEISVYILPNSTISTASGITTNEGWTTQIFQAFVLDSNGNLVSNPSVSLILDNLSNRQLIGLNVYNKILFGQNYDVEAEILSSSIYIPALSGTLLILDGDAFDETMVSLNYKIYDVTNNVYLTIPNQNIKKVAKDGSAVLVYGDITSYLSFINTYKLIVSLGALDSTDPTTGNLLPSGFWPSIDGIVVPPLGSRLGSINSSNTSAREDVDFVISSNGSLYIPENGNYLFQIVIDNSINSYADFSIDFLNVNTMVTDIVEDGAGGFEEKNVGGFFSTNIASPEKIFYLTKGWHIGRFRYIAIDNSNTNHAKVLYSKASWGDDTLRNPIIGDNSGEYSFLARSYRSIHCKIQDQNFDQKYPDATASTTSASQFCRAILGFITELQDISSSTTSNQVALIERKDFPNDDFGERISTTLPEASPTFGGQLFEEVFGIYLSSIFDGASDFRFWKTISWTPAPGLQPTGTSVQFEIRTAASESELLNKEFNVINVNGEDIRFDPFTVPGSDILRFSFTGSGDDPDNLIINRFIQFRMILKSRIRDVVPHIDDVTIVYSSQNSVSFFTTTFNLQSNLVRALLVYNGENKLDPNGVALTEIRFGISTEEVVDGIVTTNFSNYKTIPTNEVFSLSQIGMAEGKNFRIGIRLVASSEEVPSVDEFSLIWQSKGKPEQINKDIL